MGMTVVKLWWPWNYKTGDSKTYFLRLSCNSSERTEWYMSWTFAVLTVVLAATKMEEPPWRWVVMIMSIHLTISRLLLYIPTLHIQFGSLIGIIISIVSSSRLKRSYILTPSNLESNCLSGSCDKRRFFQVFAILERESSRNMARSPGTFQAFRSGKRVVTDPGSLL